MTMTAQKNDDEPVVVTQRALRRIEREIKTRLRAFFRPGERLRLSVEDEEDFVCAKMSVKLPDESAHLQLEAAMIVQDQDPRFVEMTTSRKRMLGAIEFLASRLEEYFRSQRTMRFHVDWRLYSLEAATVRFRGQYRRPKLEKRADELLDDDNDGQEPT